MKAREYMHLKWFKEGKQVRQMKTLTGAEIVIECLKEQGVDTVFGYPGGAILNIMMHFINTRMKSPYFDLS